MADSRMLSDVADAKSVKTDALIKRAADVKHPHFFHAVVLEVISDPKQITNEKVEYWKNVLKINTSWSYSLLNSPIETTDKDFPRAIPRNSIIAQKKLIGHTHISTPMLMVPFFPSHIALPCKVGELVWGLYEDPNAGGNSIAYWMCSVVQPYFAEDVNHSHPGMALRQTTPPTAAGDVKIPYQMQNGSTVIIKGKNNSYKNEKGEPIIATDSATKIIASTDQFVFEKLTTLTDAARLTIYEAIPRYHKRPGDVVLEGSNNSLIVLGTDRNSKLGEYKKGATSNITNQVNVALGLVPDWPETDFKHESGTIDMVVGRGYSSAEPPASTTAKVSVTEIKNLASELRAEQDKVNPDPKEGNPDYVNDRSRILISQRTSPDTNFKLADYYFNNNSAPSFLEDSRPDGDAAIVLKTDKIRLIARSDISFIVTNYETDSNERIKTEFKTETSEYNKWASITIKRNGDIIFAPSEEGLIKLGGEDADKAILCTDNLAPGIAGKPIVNKGKVSFPAGIISTGADVVGTGKPKQGTFATKILVK